MYCGHPSPASVCLSAAAFLHYCTDPDVTWGWQGMPPSCAILGRFAIGAQVALLQQNNANTKCQRVHACTRSAQLNYEISHSMSNKANNWFIVLFGILAYLYASTTQLNHVIFCKALTGKSTKQQKLQHFQNLVNIVANAKNHKKYDHHNTII